MIKQDNETDFYNSMTDSEKRNHYDNQEVNYVIDDDDGEYD
jgi:hypothetical protein